MRKLLTAFLALSCSLCFADTLIMKDGARHDGQVQSVTASSVLFLQNGATLTYSRSSVQSIEFSTASPSAASNTSAESSSSGSVVLPAGAEIVVMNNENIDSATATEGQTFSADVTEDVEGDAGRVVIPKGSEAELVLRKVASQGTVTGTSELVLDLQSVKVGGHSYTISTSDVQQKSANEGLGKNKRTATMVGGGAVLGTLIGAIAGGGKGAAIGAATGAAAGAGAQVITRGKAVKVPAESKLRFKLDEPLTLQSTN